LCPPWSGVPGARLGAATVRRFAKRAAVSSFPAWRVCSHQATVTLPVINEVRYTDRVLRSFRDKDAERIWQRGRSKRLDPATQRAALRKLLILDAADQLRDLRVPPGNRLEKLRGDRANTYSIRINDQWRICFRWTPAGPEDIEVVDYH
jgi:toxin HigB-1